ncbi:MAG: esterase family protein [Verrucomicrobiae bacterium]|nr:esterase family protein [Verrucomicrobiae bacterium]
MPFRTLELSDPRFAFEGLRWATVKSDALQGRADVTLFIPPEVLGRSDVPLVILLHGVYGSHWAWAMKGGAHRTASRMMAAGQIPPMVLAMPSDGLWGDGSGYVRHAVQDFGQWIVEEVPEVAREAAPAVSDRSPLFLAGLSMGGFGALRLGATHPGRFRAVSGHSSVTRAEALQAYIVEECADWSRHPEDRSVLEAMRCFRDRLPAIRFDCGTEDPWISANRELHEALEGEGIPHHYEEFPGGHTWEYWERHLSDSLQFFADCLAFTPRQRQKC